jgi:hypothetical protein
MLAREAEDAAAAYGVPAAVCFAYRVLTCAGDALTFCIAFELGCGSQPYVTTYPRMWQYRICMGVTATIGE